MVNCPKCDAVIDAEEDELDEGENLTCDECGATITVVGLDPLEWSVASDDDDDDDLEDDDDEDEDDEDDDEEEDDEEEDEEWH